MSDIFSNEKRSYIMSKIKGKNTKIEVIVSKWLSFFGYRYRINCRKYPGSPDVVIPRYKTVIFVHGCFWHAHEKCKYFKPPKTRSEFWNAKFERNMNRDKNKVNQLEKLGWKVIVIWECELMYNPEIRLLKLLEEIRGDEYNY